MSPSTNNTRPESRALAKLACRPRTMLSKTRIRATPASRSWSTRDDPIVPAPPVSRTVLPASDAAFISELLAAPRCIIVVTLEQIVAECTRWVMNTGASARLIPPHAGRCSTEPSVAGTGSHRTREPRDAQPDEHRGEHPSGVEPQIDHAGEERDQAERREQQPGEQRGQVQVMRSHRAPPVVPCRPRRAARAGPATAPARAP